MGKGIRYREGGGKKGKEEIKEIRYKAPLMDSPGTQTYPRPLATGSSRRDMQARTS